MIDDLKRLPQDFAATGGKRENVVQAASGREAAEANAADWPIDGESGTGWMKVPAVTRSCDGSVGISGVGFACEWRRLLSVCRSL